MQTAWTFPQSFRQHNEVTIFFKALLSSSMKATGLGYWRLCCFESGFSLFVSPPPPTLRPPRANVITSRHCCAAVVTPCGIIKTCEEPMMLKRKINIHTLSPWHCSLFKLHSSLVSISMPQRRGRASGSAACKQREGGRAGRAAQWRGVEAEQMLIRTQPHVKWARDLTPEPTAAAAEQLPAVQPCPEEKKLKDPLWLSVVPSARLSLPPPRAGERKCLLWGVFFPSLSCDVRWRITHNPHHYCQATEECETKLDSGTFCW